MLGMFVIQPNFILIAPIIMVILKSVDFTKTQKLKHFEKEIFSLQIKNNVL